MFRRHPFSEPLFRSLVLVVVSIFFSSPILSATTYYVSNAGDNSNNGLSLEDAFETIQHAADLASAGDSVLVEDGTYLGFDFRNKDGTAANPIVFMALGDNVLINQSGPIRNDGINIENADYVTVDGFICNDMPGNGNGIRVVLSDFCIVRNSRCDNNAERGIFTAFTDDILIENNICSNSIDEHGIYVSNSSDRPIIRFNECFGNNNIGIHMNGDLSAGGDGVISDALIYGNILYDNNAAAGINMDGLQDPIVYNNLIFNNHSAQGIALFQQDGAIVTNGAKIYNNTIIVPSDGRWGILLKDGANINTEIYNNIIINQHAWRGCIAAESITLLQSDNNIVNDKMSASGDGSTIPLSAWQALGLDLNSQISDPLSSIFTDPDLNDYSLAFNSQAIDSGTDLVSDIVSVDIQGNLRPFGNDYDIGAYEYFSLLSHDPVSFDVFLDKNGDKVNLEIGIHPSIYLDRISVNKRFGNQEWINIYSLNNIDDNEEGTFISLLDESLNFGYHYYQLILWYRGDENPEKWNKVLHYTPVPVITIYPNPVEDYLVVDGLEDNTLFYSIISANGQEIETKIMDVDRMIEMANLAIGAYTLVLFNEHQRISFPFIKISNY